MAMLATIDPLREKDRARYRGYDAKVVLGRIAWQAELAPHASAEIRAEGRSINSTACVEPSDLPLWLAAGRRKPADCPTSALQYLTAKFFYG